MKNLLLLVPLLGAAHAAPAQRHPKVFKDSTGAPTTYESYWGSTLEGRYKGARDKATNTYRLVPMPEAEFAQAKAATAKRIIATKKLGQPLPAFRVTDYRGRVFDSERLRGKVLVLNFWFVGCGPCEMEMASLNKLHAAYQHDSTVVFLSFVRSRREEVEAFLANSPFRYPLAMLDAALQAQLKPSAYPTNLVITKQGNYAFESVGAGVGSTLLLSAAIKQAAQRSK
jgi:thiol-disulfide isomerase/thioredoxin